MTKQFYVPPDQVPSGVPQSEPTVIAALRMQNQRMRAMLKRSEWTSTFIGGTHYRLCHICGSITPPEHEPDCKLADLLKETA